MPLALLLSLLMAAGLSAASQDAARFSGRSLADALQTLQAAGLRIVFTSATVTADMRVEAEPRATTPRQQLDELLAPHRLVARSGPGGVLQIVRAPPAPAPRTTDGSIEGRIIDAYTAAPLAGVLVRLEGSRLEVRSNHAGRFRLARVRPGTWTVAAAATGYAPARRSVHVSKPTTTITFELAPAANPYSEYVSVSRPFPRGLDAGVASEARLERGQMQRVYGFLVEDPLRAVQTLPRAAPVDDFRSELAVRGSPFRHVGVIVDGVPAEWLQHTAYGRSASASLTMFPGQVVEDATLRAGTYPRRYGDRLGAELDFTLREGTRRGFALHGSAGGSSATVIGEGPLGHAARGSWLVAARRSYAEWPPEKMASSRSPFGFSDGLAKIVWDVRSRQQVTLTAIGGTSATDEDDDLMAGDTTGGHSRAAVVNLSWHSTFGSSAMLTQRLYAVRQHLFSGERAGQRAATSRNDRLAYRVGLTQAIPGGLIEAGGELARSAFDAPPPVVDASSVASGTELIRTGYVHAAWRPARTLTVSPGVRVSFSSVTPHRATSAWLLGEWAVHPRWTLTGGGGISAQPPTLEHLARSGALRPERAQHVDAGVEHRLTRSVRWQVTVFRRNEDDILRASDSDPPVSGTRMPSAPARYANALQGRSGGVELLVERRSSHGPSGWVAYSFAKTRFDDAAIGERFWGDFDERHGLTVVGTYPLARSTAVGATFRAGSNFPVAGYFESRDGQLFAGGQRNQVRLPAYIRLDLRADRELPVFDRRVVLVGEVLNVFNRGNVGLARGVVDPATGAAHGFTTALMPRRFLAGIHMSFGPADTHSRGDQEPPPTPTPNR